MTRGSETFENDGPVPFKTNTFVNDFFKDNIWFINLDNRIDRLNNVLQELGKLSIKANRFSAINGKTDINIKQILKDPKTKISSNEIACTLSHREIWKNIVKNKSPWTLIMEDDIYIENEVDQTYFAEGMIDSLSGRKNTQIVFFGLCFETLKEIKTNNKFFNVQVSNIFEGYCCHCYAITWRMAEKLLEITSEFCYALDKYINYNIPNDMKTFVDIKNTQNKNNYFGKGIVKQNRIDYKSNIRNDKTNSIY